MKKKNVFKWWGVVLILFMCFVYVEVQDLKFVLIGVVKVVIGNKVIMVYFIVGIWIYQVFECQFESDQLLVKVGGEIVVKEVEEKLQIIYDKIGLVGIKYIFKEDGIYLYILKKCMVSGIYVFDDEVKMIIMKNKLGIQMVVYVIVIGNSMSFVFNVDKLMFILKVIIGVVFKVNFIVVIFNSVVEVYDGLMLGFELKKQMFFVKYGYRCFMKVEKQ